MRKRIAAFLQHRLKLPEVLLVILFSIKPWVWVAILAWMAAAPIASSYQVHGQPQMSIVSVACLEQSGSAAPLAYRSIEVFLRASYIECWHYACMQVGEIYVLVTLMTVILCNLGTRREGEASAYSIFNNFRELPGQLNANMLDDQIRRGQM